MSRLCGAGGGLQSGQGGCGHWKGFRRRGRSDLICQLLLEEALGFAMAKARAKVAFGPIAFVLKGGRKMMK